MEASLIDTVRCAIACGCNVCAAARLPRRWERGGGTRARDPTHACRHAQGARVERRPRPRSE
ncbi:hypothetical protein FOA52_010055 [Chlamydomonas sp. UWO 241]|nr:hypothetical protein FOA52_010055 [Chlamydomonas sp. UWO 241]